MSGVIRLLLVLAALFMVSASGFAREPKKTPIRALLVAGGCCHDYGRQKILLTEGLSRRADIKWTIAHDPDTSTGHKNPIYDRSDWSKDFDVIVHDECSSDVSDMNVIESILAPHKVGLPAVVLHCGMHSYRTPGWDKKVATPWMRFTGLISTGHGPQEPISIHFVDNLHTITRDLGDWKTGREELYNNAAGKLEPTAHALATGTQSYTGAIGGEITATAVVAWINTYNGKTRVFSTTLGHNSETVRDPRYLDLVTRGLLWSVDKLEGENLKAGE